MGAGDALGIVLFADFTLRFVEEDDIAESNALSQNFSEFVDSQRGVECTSGYALWELFLDAVDQFSGERISYCHRQGILGCRHAWHVAVRRVP